MSEIWFFHLERAGVETALCPLLEKCLHRGWRAIVRGTMPERLEVLDNALWTWREESFLPHGLAGRDAAARQPILLTQAKDNPNGAAILFLIDGAALDDLADYERVCVVFDGRDEAALAHARTQWKSAKDKGASLAYWKQAASGQWEKQA
jgi:DNA polymerase-3 subunit chi